MADKKEEKPKKKGCKKENCKENHCEKCGHDLYPIPWLGEDC